jgi:hypothetical protein
MNAAVKLIRELKFGLAKELEGLNESGGAAVLEYVQDLLWKHLLKVDDVLDAEYGIFDDDGADEVV